MVFILFLVFKSKYSEMQWVIERNQQHKEEDQDGGENVVRLRGLPFDSTKDDIEKFFDGKFSNLSLLLLLSTLNRKNWCRYISDNIDYLKTMLGTAQGQYFTTSIRCLNQYEHYHRYQLQLLQQPIFGSAANLKYIYIK